jgi:glutamate/tyrosine decarboxylase-like PLP-dependent enzyme
VLFRDPSVGRFYRHGSPYTYFTSGALHLGEISLECSRPGAAAAALWATHRVLPPEPGGEFAKGLEAGREAALALHRALAADDRWFPAMEPELDIVVWAPAAPRSSEVHAATRRIFDAAAKRNLHLAVAEFPADLLRPHWPDIDWDRDTVACLRSVLMKPAHREWLDRIRELLEEARAEAMP